MDCPIKRPPCLKPSWKVVISFSVEVKKPRVGTAGILLEEGIKPCLLVVPVSKRIGIINFVLKIYGKSFWFLRMLTPILRVNDILNIACGITWDRMFYIKEKVFQFD